MHYNARHFYVPIASLICLTACSSGGVVTSGQGAVPLYDVQATQTKDTSSRTVDSLTGKMGLSGSLHLVAPAAGESSGGWLSEAAKGTGPKLYVSDDGANALYIYNGTKPTTPIGVITKGIAEPVGNFVDTKGDLYVTNLSGNSVTVYARGTAKPMRTYTSGLSEPTSVVVGNDGTVYVSEYPNNAIVEYSPGKMIPARMLAVKSVQGVAIDSSNNLYASYTNPNSGVGGVEKFKPKATSGTDLGISLGDPGDLKLDQNDDLLVEDQKSDTINFYKPGVTAPYGTISTSETPFKLALNSPETLLYVATGVNYLYIFDAMPDGKPVGVLSAGFQSTSGVSLSPAPPL